MTFLGSGGAPGRRRTSLVGLMPVNNRATAQAAAKAGSTVGFVVAIADLAVAVAAQLGFSILSARNGHSQAAVNIGVTELFGLFALFNAAFAWRVKTGRGWISAILSVVLGVAQICLLFMIMDGGHGYSFFMLLLFKFQIDGVRGTWWQRKNRGLAAAEVFD